MYFKNLVVGMLSKATTCFLQLFSALNRSYIV